METSIIPLVSRSLNPSFARKLLAYALFVGIVRRLNHTIIPLGEASIFFKCEKVCAYPKLDYIDERDYITVTGTKFSKAYVLQAELLSPPTDCAMFVFQNHLKMLKIA